MDGAKTDYRVGVRGRNLELDLVWIGTVFSGYRRYPFLPIPARTEALRAVASLVNPANHFDVQSFDDPWPGLAEIPKVFRKFLSKLRREAMASPNEGAPSQAVTAEVLRSA
jgi:hypothetical protein